MTAGYFFVFVLIAVLFYFYSKAKNRQKDLRLAARRQYQEIVECVTYWSKNRTDEARFQRAKVAQQSYDETFKTVTFSMSRGGFGGLSADDFEFFDEWRAIFQEIDEKPAYYGAQVEFIGALVDLRATDFEV
jgi:hypothetical protein